MEEREALRQEVAALQQKLHQLHATDVNTFRRSYATIAQHIEALKVEASRLEALVHEVEPDIYTPDFVAQEFGKAAVVGGAGWVLYKIVKSIPPIPPKAKSWLGRGLFVATAVVISWRFASSSIGRFASAFLNHRRRKKAFLREVTELQHRIDILQAIVASLPPALSQQNLAALPAAAEPATAAAASAAAQGAAGRSGSGGNGGREQFVVVDLPRVESGGFVLPSPVPSPPPAVLAAGLAGAVDAGQGGVPSSSAGPAVSAGPFAAAAAQQGAPGPAPAAAAAAAGQEGTLSAAAGAAAAAAAGQVLRPAPQRLAAVQEASTAAGGSSAPAAGPAEQQPHVVEQLQQTLEAAAGTNSSAGYAIPDSVMKAGWGGVTQQQQQQQPRWLPPPSQQQQQQSQAGWGASAQVQQLQQQQQPQQQQASPAARQWSSGTLGEEGEFVEQPSDPEDPDAATTASGCRRTAGQLLAGAGAAAAAGVLPAAPEHKAALQRGSPASSSSEDAVLLERE